MEPQNPKPPNLHLKAAQTPPDTCGTTTPESTDDRLQRMVECKGEMAEYLNVRLLHACDEGSMSRALLLLSELHGMSHAARECGLSVACMRRQLNGTRPLYFDTVLGVMRALGLGLRAEER